MREYVLAALLLLLPLSGRAQNWDYIQSSGEYYYGVGHGATEVEASEQAMADLVGMIATHVSSDFVELIDETNRNGNIDHQSKVVSCVKTYAQSTLTNVEKWVTGEAPDVTVRRYMKRSELDRIYDSRIAKARDMVSIAEEALQKAKIDMALQYYYWAYSLIRSVQWPNEVKDDRGRVLVNWLPVKIEEVLRDVSVAYEKREGDCVDLLFSYRGEPLSSLEFTYNDGRTECEGTAKDGRGMIEMVPGYETDAYHISIEYEYKGQARGDAEMQSVLDVITKKTFKEAELSIAGRASKATEPAVQSAMQAEKALTAAQSQAVTGEAAYAETVAKVVEAIRTKRYSDASKYFTLEGLEMYNQLISYGTGRVVGVPNIRFCKGTGGRVVSRGLQMSFSFSRGTKKSSWRTWCLRSTLRER